MQTGLTPALMGTAACPVIGLADCQKNSLQCFCISFPACAAMEDLTLTTLSGWDQFLSLLSLLH